MKYKKLLIFITSLIFVTTLVFSSVFFFKIAEIDLTVNSVIGSNENLDGVLSSRLEKYNGKNILFVSVKDVKKEMENASGYVKVNSVKKVFPNKLAVDVEERVEVFAIKRQNEYYILDENFNTLVKKQENVNNVNGLPNILLDISLSDYDEETLVSSKTLSLYDEKTTDTFNEIKEFLLLRRENIASIKVNVRSDGMINRYLVFNMTEGMEIQIDRSNVLSKDKLVKMFEYYDSSENKGDTTKRYVTLLDTGEIVVV